MSGGVKNDLKKADVFYLQDLMCLKNTVLKSLSSSCFCFIGNTLLSGAPSILQGP